MGHPYYKVCSRPHHCLYCPFKNRKCGGIRHGVPLKIQTRLLFGHAFPKKSKVMNKDIQTLQKVLYCPNYINPALITLSSGVHPSLIRMTHHPMMFVHHPMMFLCHQKNYIFTITEHCSELSYPYMLKERSTP